MTHSNGYKGACCPGWTVFRFNVHPVKFPFQDQKPATSTRDYGSSLQMDGPLKRKSGIISTYAVFATFSSKDHLKMTRRCLARLNKFIQVFTIDGAWPNGSGITTRIPTRTKLSAPMRSQPCSYSGHDHHPQYHYHSQHRNSSLRMLYPYPHPLRI